MNNQKSINQLREEALSNITKQMTDLVNSDIKTKKNYKVLIQVRDMLENRYGRDEANLIVSNCIISVPEDFDLDMSELIMLYVQYVTKIIDTFEAEGFSKEQIIKMYNNFQFIMS